MRPTSWTPVFLAAITLALLLVFCNSGTTEETSQLQPGIKELQQQRLAIVEQCCEYARKLYEQGRIEYTEVYAAERELLTARLALADTPQARTTACDQAIAMARHFQEIAQARKESARGTQLEVLRARDFELQALIERAKAESSK